MLLIEPRPTIDVSKVNIGDVLVVSQRSYLVGHSIDEALGHYLICLDGYTDSPYQGEGYSIIQLREAIVKDMLDKSLIVRHYSKDKYRLKIVEV